MHVLHVIYPFVFLTLTSVLCTSPDITFGDHNDRFDVSDIMSFANRAQQVNYQDGDYDDARRQNRRQDYAYHDKMDNDGAGDQDDYERNLQVFKKNRRLQSIVDFLHNHRNRRNGGDPQKEILLHHAVPVELKIDGFLQPPYVE